jgi:Xaa-Pro aminopeptidase
MDFERRIKAVQKKIRELKLDGLIITNRKNIYYLCNFTGDSGIMFISRNGSFLITDYRFEGEIVEKIKNSEWILTRKGYVEELAQSKFFKNKKIIGFEAGSMSYSHFLYFKKTLKRSLKPVENIVEDLRTTKEKEEIEIMKKAAKIADMALSETIDFIKVGVMEKDIANELEYRMRKYGGEGASFETIVASGKRSAIPHGTASSKKIKNNEFLIIDFGTYYKGYASDCTRTFFVGKPESKDKEIFDVVFNAQKLVREKITLKMNFKDIDNIAREYITSRGYGERFTHSLGHGVGLFVHEPPTLSPKSNGYLKEGMVVTIEPGVYIKDYGGVRIEDMVVFLDGKKIFLTSFPRELQTL